jgi:hypothetical protein
MLYSTYNCLKNLANFLRKLTHSQQIITESFPIFEIIIDVTVLLISDVESEVVCCLSCVNSEFDALGA